MNKAMEEKFNQVEVEIYLKDDVAVDALLCIKDRMLELESEMELYLPKYLNACKGYMTEAARRGSRDTVKFWELEAKAVNAIIQAISPKPESEDK